MMHCDLKNWSIFDFLKSEFISKIHMTIVFDNSGTNALIVTKDGMVYGIGSNTDGCLGIGNTHSTLCPMIIDELCQKGIKTFACGKSFVLALTDKGEVYSWGKNGWRRPDDGTSSLIPTLVSTLSGTVVIDIACGSSHFLALTVDGDVYTWDKQSSQQYVYRDRYDIPYTLKKMDLYNRKIAHISCGNSFSAVVTDDGEVYRWNSNNENDTSQSTPSKFTFPSGTLIVKVVCGFAHMLALSYNGNLYVWGQNNCRQLGITGHKNNGGPNKLKVQEMGRVLDIAASYHSNISVAMGKNNQIFVWGKCLAYCIKVPTLTRLKCLHDAFARYASPIAMHQPLILNYEEETSLIDSMKEAFDDAATSDLIIRVHGKPIHVHKAVLKIRCHYFRTMFQEHWTENSQSVIEHEEFSYDVYKSFLRYLYINKVELPPENALELLNLANAYSESQLKRCCIEMIKRGITVANVAFLYNVSLKYNSKELEDYCFKYALNHMTEMVQTANFSELEGSVIQTFIIKAAKAGAFRT